MRRCTREPATGIEQWKIIIKTHEERIVSYADRYEIDADR